MLSIKVDGFLNDAEKAELASLPAKKKRSNPGYDLVFEQCKAKPGGGLKVLVPAGMKQANFITSLKTALKDRDVSEQFNPADVLPFGKDRVVVTLTVKDTIA
jgi:hypothetical protein